METIVEVVPGPATEKIVEDIPVKVTWWSTFQRWFQGSVLVLWARLQTFIGILWAVLVTVDLSPFLTNPKYMAAWVIFNGVVTESLRQRTLHAGEGRE